MDFSAGLALAKGESFISFLILVALLIAVCWQHYEKAARDVICETPKTEPSKPAERV